MKMNKYKSVLVLIAMAAIAMMGISCTNNAANADNPPVQQTAIEQTAVEPAAPTGVAKIVFVDKEKACKCTAEKIEKSWTALAAALKAKGVELPIERVHLDTQAAEAGKYKALKPMIAIPGIYLLNADGKLIELLQGEVTTEQVEKVL
jgi:hypothetical protein